MSQERNSVPSPPTRPPSNPPPRPQIIWKAGGPPQLEFDGTVLFYPGTGSDWKAPVRLFGPWVDTFVFVDKDLGRVSDDLSESLMPFNLNSDRSQSGRGQGRRSQSLDRIERAGVKVGLESGRNVEINWLQQDALEALTQLDDQIGVFFYRGDSSEGSNLWWLFHAERVVGNENNPEEEAPGEDEHEDWDEEENEEEDSALHGLLHEVLRRLTDGALIVTDGSKGDGDGTNDPQDPHSYSQISSFHGRRDIDPADAMNQAEMFEGPLGHTFECIGCISPRRPADKGPVLIWQVSMP